MVKCSKCLTELEEKFLVKYTDLAESWALCHQCHRVFDCKEFLIREFLKEDYGKFPIEKISKMMIEARKRRSLGECPWNQKTAKRA